MTSLLLCPVVIIVGFISLVVATLSVCRPARGCLPTSFLLPISSRTLLMPPLCVYLVSSKVGIGLTGLFISPRRALSPTSLLLLYPTPNVWPPVGTMTTQWLTAPLPSS